MNYDALTVSGIIAILGGVVIGVYLLGGLLGWFP